MDRRQFLAVSLTSAALAACGGGDSASEGIVLDLQKMNAITLGDGSATIGAGGSAGGCLRPTHCQWCGNSFG